jgi:hypothetical protein
LPAGESAAGVVYHPMQAGQPSGAVKMLTVIRKAADKTRLCSLHMIRLTGSKTGYGSAD